MNDPLESGWSASLSGTIPFQGDNCKLCRVVLTL
jgi:hypothetical protein